MLLEARSRCIHSLTTTSQTVYIKTLTLTNYRGVKSLSLDLDKRLNVFVGVNGAGKSTVLDAMVTMLSCVVSQIGEVIGKQSEDRQIVEDDIRNEADFTSIALSCIDKNRAFQWRIAASRRGDISLEKPTDLTQLETYTEQLKREIIDHQESINIPLFVYYPVNRAVLDIPLKIKTKHRFDLLNAYDESLISGTNFRKFFEWFREREDLENEQVAEMREQPLFHNQIPYDPQLQAVRKALNQFLPNFKNLRVRRNPLRMEIEKNGEILTVNQLSDGEKCLIAMVSDLARRCAIANPERLDPLQGEGVVLIDEIDLHLHPKWQRMIVPRLLEVFPNCQFFISTHSPHVLTHVQSEQIFLLKQTEDGIQWSQPDESYGKNVDRVLEDLMELDTTRPTVVSNSIHNIYEMIDKNNLQEAQDQVSEMRSKIGNDPELLKAEVLIKRKERIGK